MEQSALVQRLSHLPLEPKPVLLETPGSEQTA